MLKLPYGLRNFYDLITESSTSPLPDANFLRWLSF
jgi:hypothetical protein